MIQLETYFLVKALKAGDLTAFEKVYKSYYSRLFGFSKQFEHSSLEANDFVQQTFVRLWEQREKLKEEILLDKQIFLICRNLILNQLKRDKKINSQSFNPELSASEMDNYPDNDDDDDETSAKKNRLRKCINEMPAKRKEIFLMHKINNLSYEEISENLGISKKTIANHIYLATVYLKENI